MKTKTCGECKHHKDGWCVYSDDPFEVEKDSLYCDDRFFAPKPTLTNGDRIRQKSNEEFARDYVHYHSEFKVYVARLCPLNKQLWTTREEAKKANLDWLNAPADCVTENGKSAKQEDLIRKSAKESKVYNRFAKCEYCGKMYRKKKKAQRFCSIKCKDRWWNHERAVDREYLHPQCEDNFNGEW